MDESKSINQLIQSIAPTTFFFHSLKTRKKRRQYRATFNWLNNLQEFQLASRHQPDDLNKQVHKILEIFYHLCSVKDLERSIQALEIPVKKGISNSLDLPVYEHLLFEGRNQDLLKTLNHPFLNASSELDSYAPLKIFEAKALEGLGHRSTAIQLYETVLHVKQSLTQEYLEAFSRLAICQLQMGQYQTGLPRLRESLERLKKMEGRLPSSFLMNLKNELLENLAFYKMTVGHFDEAFNLFGQAFSSWHTSKALSKAIVPLAHQGIVLRKSAAPKRRLIKMLLINLLRFSHLEWLSNFVDRVLYPSLQLIPQENYEKSEQLLNQAYDLSVKAYRTNTKAWIQHHLGWVLINKGQGYLAESMAHEALEQYRSFQDDRGISDCWQQIGLIFLSGKQIQLKKAEEALRNSLEIRLSINNLHGAASSRLSLAALYWHQDQFFKSIFYLTKAIVSYRAIGALNIKRIIGILVFFSVWTIGNRDWTM